MNWNDHGKPFLLIICIAIFLISLIAGIIVQFIPVEGKFNIISLQLYYLIHYWYISVVFLLSVVGMHFLSVDIRKNSNDRRWEEVKKKFSQSKKNLSL